MKICFINKSFANKYWDGIAAYTHNMAISLGELGHEVYIITLDNGANYLYKNVHIHKIKNIFNNHENFKIRALLNEIFYSILVYFKFREINKKFNIDIVESPDVTAEGFWISLFFKKKLTTRLHAPLFIQLKYNNEDVTFFRSIISRLEKIQVSRSSALSSPTEIMKDILVKEWRIEPEKIKVIPNLMNKKTLGNIRPIKFSNYILFIGRLEKHKGINEMLESFEEITRKYPGIKLIIAGGIHKSFNIAKMYKNSLKAKKNIVFLGEVDHDLIASYIKQARIVAMPSYWENCPYTILESLQLGKVLIATKSGGLIEMLQDDVDGFLVQPKSARELGRKIIEILGFDNKNIKIIEANAVKKFFKYDSFNVIPKFLEYYSYAVALNRPEREMPWRKIPFKYALKFCSQMAFGEKARVSVIPVK